MTDQLGLAGGFRSRRHGLASPLVGEIVEALVELGGEADRQHVADRIARRRGEPRASPALLCELRLALSLHCQYAVGADLEPALAQAGDTWALAPDALAFFSRHMRRQADA